MVDSEHVALRATYNSLKMKFDGELEMEGGNNMTLRNMLRVVRYGLSGSILAIAVVQGFFPEIDINNLWPGVAGFALAAGSTAKALAVI